MTSSLEELLERFRARPQSQWTWDAALSPEELQDYRRVMGHLHGGAPDTVYTCDDCGAAPHCTLAFEPYNTDGDCLADK